MSAPPRVLVLGGGMGGLAAAWRLSEPGWREHFSSITVLERSGRLGGKGASSRGRHGRIEEHGLHVWLGHYDNAFRLVRECYAELDRERTDPLCPIRTWRDAFFPAGQVGLFDRGAHGWDPWVARFSGNPLLPGEPRITGHSMTLAELVTRAALLIRDFYASLDLAPERVPAVTLSASFRPPRSSRPATAYRGLASTVLAVTQQLLVIAGQGAGRLAGPPGAAAINATFAPLLSVLVPGLRTNAAARRLHELIDHVRVTLLGMALDRLTDHREAYDAINHLDLREWLHRHGAHPSTLNSSIVRGLYDLAFAYEGGDPARPRAAAGWAVFGAAKLWFEYQGSFFWKMRAGMGDVVFAPLYQALLARGVRFRFFSPVTELVPEADGSAIRSVVVSRETGPEVYEPLTRIKGLPCFGSEPAAPAPPEHEELRRGEDFDQLVFAIPPGAARLVCGLLGAQRAGWWEMLDGIGTVATHAFQLWLTPDERSLGWAHPGTTMSAFARPFETWASMSHLIEFENWPGVEPPRTLGYFCSSVPETGGAEGSRVRTREAAIGYLRRSSRHFWPAAVDPGTGEFRWELLCGDGVGPDRFDSQFWTANTDPSDRYVQYLPGTDRHRLRPDGSGYANMVLAGDWTDCGYNVGCIESAVLSGLQAANALLGRPRLDRISGLLLR